MTARSMQNRPDTGCRISWRPHASWQRHDRSRKANGRNPAEPGSIRSVPLRVAKPVLLMRVPSLVNETSHFRLYFFLL